MSVIQWYRVSPERERAHVRIMPQSAMSGDEPLQRAETAVSFGDQLFLSNTEGKLCALRLDVGSMALQTEIEQNVESCYQQLSAFWLGNRLHLLAYRQSSGVFDFFRITERAFEHVYRFQRTYGDTTDGYTTVHAYASRNLCLFMGYNGTTGMSRIYAIQVPPRASMNVTQLWQSKWSDGWRHFCFFDLGGENFFFKINPPHKKVNIDHYLDDPAQGAYAVCSHLPQLPAVSAASAVQLLEGPGFAAYQAQDGLLSVNGFHTDCQGWLTQGQCNADPGFQSLLAVALGGGESLLALRQ